MLFTKINFGKFIKIGHLENAYDRFIGNEYKRLHLQIVKVTAVNTFESYCQN